MERTVVNCIFPKMNVYIFYSTITVVVKSVLENSSMYLPLGISELEKMQIVGSRTAQKRK